MTIQSPVAVHTTKAGVQVYVEPGNIGKNRWDFKVSHETDGDPYPVTHGDLVCETYRKGLAAGDDGFKVLVNHLLSVIEKTQGIDHPPPPALVQFSHDDVGRLQQAGLDKAGEYDLELFLVLFELVEIQEFTNYPRKFAGGRLVLGFAPGQLYKQIGDNPEDLAEVAYRTEIVVPRNDNPRTRAKMECLLGRLREIVNS